MCHENPVPSENEDSDENQMLDDDEDELFSDDRSLRCSSSSTSVVSMHSKFTMNSYGWFLFLLLHPRIWFGNVLRMLLTVLNFSASIDPGFIPRSEDDTADMDTSDVCDFDNLTDNYESSGDEQLRENTNINCPFFYFEAIEETTTSTL